MTAEDIYQRINRSLSNIAKEIVVLNDVSSSKRVYLKSYFLTVYHFEKSISDSIRSKNFIAIAPLLRSQLEAYVELLNLCNHKNYEKVLFSNHLHQKIKMIRQTLKDPENPFFSAIIHEMADREETIRVLEDELILTKDSIGNFKGDYKQIKTRFRYANLEPVYVSVYSVLCQDTHNSLISIERRHLESTNGSVKISNKINWSIEEVIAHILTSLSILQSSLEYIFIAFNHSKPEKVLNELIEDQTTIESYYRNKYR